MSENYDFKLDEDFARRYRQYRQVDGDRAFERFRRRVCHQQSRARIIARWAVGAAAAAAVVAGVVFFAGNPFQSSPIDGHEMIAAIAPGQSRAYLTTADGVQTALDGDETVIDRGFASIADESADKAKTMRVDVPRGGEYRIVLADGTKVHLNAESSLTFPSTFAADVRRVELTGEAYFEVEHSDGCPFVVTAHGMEARQYGTRFAVQAYGSERVVVTLAQGSIGVGVAGRGERLLTPGKQAVVCDGEVTISDADVAAAMGWTNGLLVFDNQPLGDIARTLSRWYDVDIHVDDALRGTRFTGSLSRRGSLADILDAIAEITGMKYDSNGKDIVLSI